MSDKVIVETKRLLLREYTPDDLQDIYGILSDPETMRYYPAPFDLDACRRWIAWNIDNYAAYAFGLWAVILKRNRQFIGDCGITMQKIDGQLKPEIGYHISKFYTNSGYATEAAGACAAYAFDVLHLDAVYSYMKYTNIPSQRVAEKIGMQFVCEYDDPANTRTRVFSITQDAYCENSKG